MTGRRKTTDITSQLAEDMIDVLDFLSRVVGAADNGSPNYMHDKARQLAAAANRLHAHMSDRSDTEPPFRHDPTKTFDPARLRELISRDARHYVAGRALYPLGNDAAAAARRHALESAANAIRFDPATGFTPTQADVIATWLLERASREVSG